MTREEMIDASVRGYLGVNAEFIRRWPSWFQSGDFDEEDKRFTLRVLRGQSRRSAVIWIKTRFNILAAREATR